MAQQPDTPIESPLVRTLLNGDFALTAEITPPVAASADTLLGRAAVIRNVVDAVNVTDGASARVHMSSLAAAALLVRAGIEPILQMTCRDRNRIALQADLLGAAALGVHNLLILTGDDPTAGDQPDAKPVFDLKSGELLKLAAAMRDEGIVASGRAIEDSPRFYLGAADTPLDPPAGWRPDALIAKADAGAQFIQTQLCFDIDVIRAYIARLRDFGLTDRLFVLIGVGPLASARSARWMRDNLWGVVMPDRIIERLEAAAEPRLEGASICAELLEQMSEIPGVAGAHLMAPGAFDSIPQAIEMSGLLARRGTL